MKLLIFFEKFFKDSNNYGVAKILKIILTSDLA